MLNNNHKNLFANIVSHSAISLTLFLLISIAMVSAEAQNKKTYRISGKVYDALTSETLIAAGVINKKNPDEWAFTDENGNFSLDVKENSPVLLFSCLGYKEEEKELNLKADSIITIYLYPSAQLLGEILVTADSFKERQRKQGVLSVPVNKLREIPPMLGEADILKSLQYIPGVTSVSEGKSDLSVRGSGSDHNLILIDGMPIYNSNHVFGLLSTINPESIKNVSLYKSNQPARFGGRTASIIDIRTKDGNKENVCGSVSIGNISGRANIEIPIIKSQSSLSLSARRSFLDMFLPLLLSGNEDKTNFSFYDLNGKFNHRVNEKLAFSALYYYSSDLLSNINGKKSPSAPTSESKWKWSNSGIQLRSDFTLTDRLAFECAFSNVSYNKKDISKQKIQARDKIQVFSLSSSSKIKDYILNISMKYKPLNWYTLRGGGEYLKQDLHTNIESGSKEDKKSHISRLGSDKVEAYLENDMNIGRFFNLNMGLRATLYNLGSKWHKSLSPRMSAGVNLPGKKLALRFDYSDTRQYIQQVSNNSVFLQSDVWLPANEKHPPLHSRQAGIEILWSPTECLDISFASFGKTMENLLDYKDGVSFLKNLDKLDEKLITGKGRAYGLELGLEGRFGALKTTLSYTLSKSERSFNDINSGLWFPAAFDYTHNFYSNASYKLNKRFTFTASWVYRTGGLQTLPLEEVSGAVIPDLAVPAGKEYLQIPHRNNYRLPAYHRLDLSAAYRFDIRKWGTGSINLSIYNAYNRMNVYRFFIERQEGEGGKLDFAFKKMTMYPILPSLNLNLEF